MDPKNERIARLVLEFLIAQDTPIAEKRLLNSVLGRKQSKVVTIRLLLAGGKVIRTGSGRKADPYLYSVVTLPDFNSPPDAQKADSSSTDEHCPATALANQPSWAGEGFFKEYVLPTGEVLRLTKDEFDRVLEVVRLLNRQSQKLGYDGAV